MVTTALLLGTAAPTAPWHPVEPVAAELVPLLADLVSWELNPATEVGLVISYLDVFKLEVTEVAAQLVRFVEGGGSLLVLHNGISPQSHPGFAAMLGAKFTGHPAFCPLNFRVSAPDHPVCRGLESTWVLDEEPYRFEGPGANATILYEYNHEGAWYPAAWTRKAGQGQVVYLMPGHTSASLRHPAYQALVRSAVKWLVGEGRPSKW